ncbi:MAG: VWA domain-containing protein [Acidobacteria bacterium]|nr:MAG: VWA domain-containing protein [Acidobacteriota bacterium]
MRTIVLLILAVLMPAGPAWAQADERTVFASVVDKRDAPVSGLSASEFIVRENDMAREVLRASPATGPLQIALLVDTSQAIEDHLLDIRNALGAFFKQMGGRNEIALIGFGERPTTLVDLTKDVARLQKGIGAVFARQGSGTYLLDAIVETADAFRRRETARPHIIVFAARGPEFSERHHQTVIEALQESGATLHTLMLNRPGVGLNSREEQELQLAVANGTSQSGGRREDLLTAMALDERLRSIGNELEHQYQVTYARPRTLIPPKSLEVSVKRPGVTVRARRWPAQTPESRPTRP